MDLLEQASINARQLMVYTDSRVADEKSFVRLTSVLAAVALAEETKRLADAQETANRIAFDMLEQGNRSNGIAITGNRHLEKTNGILLEGMGHLESIAAVMYTFFEEDEIVVEDKEPEVYDTSVKDFFAKLREAVNGEVVPSINRNVLWGGAQPDNPADAYRYIPE